MELVNRHGLKGSADATGCQCPVGWGVLPLERAGVVLELALEAAADGFAEIEDAGIGDEVDDVGTLASAAEDGGLGEGLEVAGGVGLGEAGGLDELGDAEFAVAEALEDAEAGGFAEDAEACGDELDGLVGEDVWSFRHGKEKRPRNGLRQHICAYTHMAS